MKKNLIFFLSVLIVTVNMLSFEVCADNGSVVFFDSATNAPIDEFSDSERIYAGVSTNSSITGNANFIVAGYDSYGNMTDVYEFTPLSVTEGQPVMHKTSAIATSGVETVKIFLWGGENGLMPVLDKTGIIDRVFTGRANHLVKFEPILENGENNPIMAVNNREIELGTLLKSVDGVTVNNEYVTILKEKADGSSADFTYTQNSSDWTKTKIVFSGEGNIKLIIKDYDFCIPTEIYINVVTPFDRYNHVFKNADQMLYRVGNKNNVKLSSLFSITESQIPVSDMTLTVTNIKGDAQGTVTTNGTDLSQGYVKFTGTGVVKVTIYDDYSNSTELFLEVVDAKNVTLYSELENKNCVLLNDIKMSSGSKFKFTNARLYGNGFTFDISDGGYSGTNLDENYLIRLDSSTIDNVKIIGAVYTQYGDVVSADYNRAAVYSKGNTVIANSYISNCMAPVRVNGGNILVKNTTLKGGCYANMDIRGGNITLEDVTTINQVGLNDTADDGSIVIGLGITVYYEGVPDNTVVNVNGNLNQYNHVQRSDSKYVNDSKGQQLVIDMFDQTNLIYTDENGIKWVNTGILSMTESIGDDSISDVPGYLEASPTYSGKTGYVHSPSPSAPGTPEEYVSGSQLEIEPQYSFDYKKTYLAKTDGSNDYCYYDGEKILISFDEGETFSWDTSILTASKAGKTLDYTVSMNGVDYTGKSIVFDTEGEYTVTYKYTDNDNYKIDSQNNITTYDVEYTKDVVIKVSEVAPDAKPAEFTFGSNNTPSTSIKIGNDTYVMPADTSLSYTTVSGNKIYCPTVEMFTSDGKWEHAEFSYWHACFPVFKDAVTITDYADGGTGEAIIYDSTTQALPTGLSVPAGPGKAFQYSASAEAPTEPVIEGGILCYISPTLSNNPRDEETITTKYEYVDNMGNTYYYYIKYHCKKHTVKDITCITPQTLITLSDGSQKAVKDMTGEEELLVWDHEKAGFDTAPVAYIYNHHGEESDYEVITLFFDDGKEIEIIGEHVFFDKTLNKYVTLDTDAKNFTGHEFLTMTDNKLTSAKLTEVKKEIRKTGVYEVVSYENIACFTNNILSASGYTEKLLNIFEIDQNTIGYDIDKKNADVKTYGLYTYDDFEGKIPENVFDMYNAKHLKVAVGKGYITWEDILLLIEFYHGLGIVPLQ